MSTGTGTDNEFGNNYGGDDDEAAAWGECDRALEKTGSGVFLKLPDDGCRADVAFLGAPRPRDFVPKDPRAGEDGPKTYFDFNVFCFTTGRGKGEDLTVGLVKVWSMNPSTFKQVRTFAENFPAFRTTQFRIVRSGEKGNSKTTYAIMPLGPIGTEWQAYIAAQPLHKLGGAYDAARAAQAAAAVPAPRPAPMTAPPPRPGPPAPPVAPPAPESGGWYLSVAGESIGPLTATEIMRRSPAPDVPAWRDGLPGWVSVGQVPELRPAPVAPPAPPRPAGPPPLPAPAAPPAMPPAMPATPAMEVNAATLAALQNAPTEEALKTIMGAAAVSTTDAAILAAYTSAYKVRLFDLTGEMPF